MCLQFHRDPLPRRPCHGPVDAEVDLHEGCKGSGVFDCCAGELEGKEEGVRVVFEEGGEAGGEALYHSSSFRLCFSC